MMVSDYIVWAGVAVVVLGLIWTIGVSLACEAGDDERRCAMIDQQRDDRANAFRELQALQTERTRNDRQSHR